MLCGFANFSSIGIQIGGIGALAPNQRKNLAKFGLKALSQIFFKSNSYKKIYREIKEGDSRPDFERIINWVK